MKKPQKADLPSLAFDYHPSPLRIVDNGHTIMVDYAPGSSLRVGDREYELKQFHFHRPSEERIHGKRYEMSVHLVHADAAGQLAVVAILLETGPEQPLLRELWNDLPTDKGKENVRADIQIDVTQHPRRRSRASRSSTATTRGPSSRSTTGGEGDAIGSGYRFSEATRLEFPYIRDGTAAPRTARPARRRRPPTCASRPSSEHIGFGRDGSKAVRFGVQEAF